MATLEPMASSEAYAVHCRDTVRPMLRRWSDWMVIACVASAVIFFAVAASSAASNHLGGPMVSVAGFLMGGCLTLFALTWRFFSLASLQMLQLLETVALRYPVETQEQ